MVRLSTLPNWAHVRAWHALNLARLAYLSVLGLAIVYVPWAALGLPRIAPLEDSAWWLACALALFGLSLTRMQRSRLAHCAPPMAIWPAGLVALMGLLTSSVYAGLLALGWFELYQSRSASELVPGRLPPTAG